MEILITIIKDYDDYFEAWAKRLAKELEKLNSSIKEITVNSGPYRSYGMSYDRNDDVLSLDFYSAVRTGFGSIGCSPEELAKVLVIKEND